MSSRRVKETPEQTALRIYEQKIRPEAEMRQIHYYMEKNAELQQKKDDLANQVLELKHQLEEERDEALKNEQYKLQSEQKDTKINELEAQISKLEREHLAAVKLVQLEKTQLENEKNDKIDALNQELSTLNMFRARKAEIEQEEKRMKARIKEMEEQHSNQIDRLEASHGQQIKELKASIEEEKGEIQNQLIQFSQKSLDLTTKTTILENVKLGVELGFQSKEAHRLMEENAKHKKRLRKYRLEAELLEEEKVQLAKKHISSQKVVKMLMARVKELEDMLDQSVTKDNVQNIVVHKDQEINQRENDINSLLQERQNMIQDMELMQNDIVNLQAEQQEMLSVLNEAAGFIVSLLNQNNLASSSKPGFMPSSASLDSTPPMSNFSVSQANSISELSIQGAEDMTPLERERALRQILAKLNFFQGDQEQDSYDAQDQQQQLHQLEQYQQQQIQLQQQQQQQLLQLQQQQEQQQTVETADIGVQTESVQKLLFFADSLPQSNNLLKAKLYSDTQKSSLGSQLGKSSSGASIGEAQSASAIAALSAEPVRKWGKKAKDLPLSKHTPEVFLRRKSKK